MTQSVVPHTLAANFGLPLFDLTSFNPDYLPREHIKESLVRRHHVLPLYKNGQHLFVAMVDPTQQIALDEIKFHSGLMALGIIVEKAKLEKLIEKFLHKQQTSALHALDGSNFTHQPKEADPNVTLKTDDAPLVRFVHQLLLDAVHKGASDIHFEPYAKCYRVRLRQDGQLHEIANPPLAFANRIAARLKVMAKLDISERRLPQDGRFKLNISSKRAIDFRVSSCPTVAGEKIVLRILDSNNTMLGVDALGFSLTQKAVFLDAIQQPQGMVLVTGPTGSGKTVTLYTALNILNQANVNISSVEDPVEIPISGINQVNIHPKAGLSFASVLRAFLRQDPDIIMIGEMRDLETATIAVKAAQTGHLVLSTLHTNNAPESLTRLVNLGLPLYNVATSISLIIAQRLLRRLCDQCKKVEKLPPQILQQAGFTPAALTTLTLYAPQGCENCRQGYKGRVGIYEMLPITAKISDAILNGMTSIDIAKIAHADGIYTTLREAALLKAQQGLTSLAEVNRVIQKD